jgi:predicted tellurium resistance membrane protein TerC
LGLIAQNLDPAPCGVSLPSIFSSFGGVWFWIGVPQIALVNVVLSGDTAVVIALACRGLPPAGRP